jgi:hypothetical protein
MRSDELVSRLRKSAFIGDASAYPEYPDSELFNELNDRLRSVFSDGIISARSGYWLSTIVTPSVAGGARMPSRSVVGGLESVEVLSNGQYFPLNECTPLEAAAWTQPNTPHSYWCDSEKIVLVPTPPSAVTLRLRYYLRPSLLVTSQSSTQGGAAADRGRITSVDPVTRIVAVNVVPFDYAITVPAAITTGAIVDVVRANGWFTPTVVSASTSIAGLNITLTVSSTLTDAEFADCVRIGDYVRVQEQSDWPALPQDFHRMLADAGAVNVLREMGLTDKAEILSGAASADYARFAKLIQPRVKSRPKKIRLKPYWARR